MTARGFVVIAADPLGVGDSGRPEDGTLCTYDALADAAHGAVQLIRGRLADGTLVADLPPIAAPHIVGVGHSMGGGLVVLQQARWGSYDAIAVLGYTHGAKARAVSSGDDAALRATAVEQAKGFWGDQWDARYGVVDKAPHQSWLNGPDAPADIVAADNANAVIWAAEPYVDALHVGYTAAYAARVTAPVMIAFGEFDIAEQPRDEAAFYERSNDITLFVLAGSYHCHNFQDGRARLWDRLGAWATEAVTASALVGSIVMHRPADEGAGGARFPVPRSRSHRPWASVTLAGVRRSPSCQPAAAVDIDGYLVTPVPRDAAGAAALR